MRFKFSFVAILTSLALSIFSGDAHSQSGSRTRSTDAEAQGDGSGTVQEPESEEAKAFRELQTEIRKNQVRVDYLYRTIPIGFPGRRKLHKDEISRLTNRNLQLKAQVFEKAKAAFQASENPSLQSVKILEKQLKACLTPKSKEQHFAPEQALELIAMMTKKFPEAPALRQSEFIANYAIERFENAEKALGKLEELSGNELAGPKKLLQDTMDKYQQELMIRRQESGNDDLPIVLLRTNEGNIKVQLFENHAPNTVANFIHLVRDQKFYDGKIFHLVKPGEFAVTGSPNGDGMGGPGYRIACECHEENIRSHFRGTLSMMAGSKDSGGSQFFITHQPNPHTYDGRYTAFGRVVEGMDVVLKLHTIDRTAGVASATNASKIVSAEVLRARDHAYKPEKVRDSGFGFGPTFGDSASDSGSEMGSDSVTRDNDAFGSGSTMAPDNDFAAGNRFEDGGATDEDAGGDDPFAEEAMAAPSAFDLLLQNEKREN